MPARASRPTRPRSPTSPGRAAAACRSTRSTSRISARSTRWRAPCATCRIDLLINNAGVYGPASQTAADFDPDGWLTTFRVNTLAPMRMVQAFLPHLRAGTGKTVATLTSQMGSITNNDGGYYAYRSAKAALNSAMRGLSVDLKGDNLVLVVMHPGWVKTDMGGDAAPLRPEDSVRDMRGVIAGLGARDNGRFFNHDGSELPW